MGFTNFIGRVLLASVFILAAWQEYNQFGKDGGPTARSLQPKLTSLTRKVSARINLQVPQIDAKKVVAAAIGMKALGSIFFILGSTAGAHLLLLHQAVIPPIMYDFFNHDVNKREFMNLLTPFVRNIALLGALLLYIGMNSPTPRKRHIKKKTN